MDMPPLIRKRCRRCNTPNHAHYLTFSCFRRQPFLAGDRARMWLRDSIANACVKHDLAILAWVFMPEHVHLLIYPQRRDYAIPDILNSIKKPVTNRAIRHVRQHAPDFLVRMRDESPNGTHEHRFWQRGGGYDRNIHSAEEVWEKIRYIHMNPVRRSLVERAELWEWSSAADYLGSRESLLPLRRDILPHLRQ